LSLPAYETKSTFTILEKIAIPRKAIETNRDERTLIILFDDVFNFQLFVLMDQG